MPPTWKIIRLNSLARTSDEFEPGSKICCGIVVEVAGKNMQSDFEPVLERKFHNYLNCAEGIMNTGQRDLIRIRISNDAL